MIALLLLEPWRLAGWGRCVCTQQSTSGCTTGVQTSRVCDGGQSVGFCRMGAMQIDLNALRVLLWKLDGCTVLAPNAHRCVGVLACVHQPRWVGQGAGATICCNGPAVHCVCQLQHLQGRCCVALLRRYRPACRGVVASVVLRLSVGPTCCKGCSTMWECSLCAL